MPKLSGVAMKRLAKEWERLRDTPGEGADMVTGGPLNEEDMSVWSVKCTNLDHADASAACKIVGEELKKKGYDPAIEFRIHFPESYPADPPFVYLHAPRVIAGHIHENGAMCLDVLHPAGWTPATKVDSLLRTIRSDIDNMTLPIRAHNWCKPDGTLWYNTAASARKTNLVIGSSHDWNERRAAMPPPAKRQRGL